MGGAEGHSPLLRLRPPVLTVSLSFRVGEKNTPQIAAEEDVAVGPIPKLGSKITASPAPAALAAPTELAIDETSIPKVAKKAPSANADRAGATGSRDDEPATTRPPKTAAAPTSTDPSIAAAAAGLSALSVPDGSDGAEVDGITAPEKVTSVSSSATSKQVPLDGFKPAWSGTRPASSVIAELITDTPLEDVKTNQVPLIQSLAAAANTPLSQVYFYRVTEGVPVNGLTFLIDTKDEAGRQSALRGLGDGTKTAKFYANAKAFKVNVVNGPSVPAEEVRRRPPPPPPRILLPPTRPRSRSRSPPSRRPVCACVCVCACASLHKQHP